MTFHERLDAALEDKPEFESTKATMRLSMARWARQVMAGASYYSPSDLTEAQEVIARAASDMELAREIMASSDKHIPLVVDLAREFIAREIMADPSRWTPAEIDWAQKVRAREIMDDPDAWGAEDVDWAQGVLAAHAAKD
jgi:hypothetical protein